MSESKKLTVTIGKKLAGINARQKWAKRWSWKIESNDILHKCRNRQEYVLGFRENKR